MKKIVFASLLVLLVWLVPSVQGKATESLGTVTDAEETTDLTAVVEESSDGVNAAREALSTVIEASADGTDEFGTASGLGTGKVVAENTTRMKYLARVGASIHIMDDGTATVTADAVSYDPALTNLLVVAELQQLRNGDWYTLRTYRYFTGDNAAIISETCEVARGYYYRVVNTTTAYAGSDSETRVAETPEWNFFVPGT